MKHETSGPDKAPAGAPCVTCPYRKDAPSGLWHADEYAILPEFDRPTHEQPMHTFGCHQQDGRLCAGWVATHDMSENMAIRIALLEGRIDGEILDACLEYETPVEVFESGAAAMEHGLNEYDNPSPQTEAIADKLVRTKSGVHRA